MIDGSDDQYLLELLSACKRGKVDLLLETPGGFTDATEKVCSLLRTLAPDLRVIVPRRAKSNGTVIALAGSEILMSASSELGPIDPSFNGVPVDFVLAAPAGSFDAITMQVAETLKKQTEKLATQLLSTGMMKDNAAVIPSVVEKLASRVQYHSHGSVIDADEAAALGLKVQKFELDDELWSRIWLLRTMYAYDSGIYGYGKIFEGEFVSSAVIAPKVASTP
jgi:ClpP class serine protease